MKNGILYMSLILSLIMISLFVFITIHDNRIVEQVGENGQIITENELYKQDGLSETIEAIMMFGMIFALALDLLIDQFEDYKFYRDTKLSKQLLFIEFLLFVIFAGIVFLKIDIRFNTWLFWPLVLAVRLFLKSIGILLSLRALSIQN